MRRLFLCILLVCASMAACGGSDARMNASSNMAVNSDPEPSFGQHDLASTRETSGSANTANTVHAQKIAAVPERKSNADIGSTASAEQKRRDEPAPSIDARPTDRKIIRNAELDLEAESPEDAQRKITSIAELKGGFVVDSKQSTSEITSNSRDIVSVTVRVPSERFSETLSDIRNVSTRVVLETVKGQDVTEEFIDIEAQIRAKKALEQQFMEIMKRANTVNEALTVQGQLADVRGDIERVEGRKRFLENQSSLSTIKIRVQTAKVFAAQSAGFGERLSNSFMDGADVAFNFLLGLVTVIVAVLPFGLFIGLPAFLLFRYVWKRQMQPRSVVDLAEDEFKRA